MVKTAEKYSLDAKRLKLLIRDLLRVNDALRLQIRSNAHPPSLPDVLQYQLDQAARHLDSILQVKGLRLFEIYSLANNQMNERLKIGSIQSMLNKLCPLADEKKVELFLTYLDKESVGQVTFSRYSFYMGCLGLLDTPKENLHFRGMVLQRFVNMLKKIGSASSFYDKYDEDGDGRLTILQLKRALADNRALFPPEQILVIARYMDPAQKGICSKESFRQMVSQFDQYESKEKAADSTAKQLEELKMMILKTKTDPMKIFNEADLGGMGIVTESEMLSAFAKVWPKQSKEQIGRWVKVINEDGDEYVERMEYESFFRGLLTEPVFEGLQEKPKESKKSVPQKKMTTEMILLKLKQKCKQEGITAKELFARLDLNKDKEISLPQFKQGLISIGLSVSGALKIMSLFDEDASGTVSEQEFVEAMGEDYEAGDEEGEGEEGDFDFDLEREEGDQALPEGHELAKRIQKQQETKIVQMQKRLAKAYSKNTEHILSFFKKYEHRQRITLDNYYRVVGQILSISDKPLLVSLGQRATSTDSVEFLPYLDRISDLYGFERQSTQKVKEEKGKDQKGVEVGGNVNITSGMTFSFNFKRKDDLPMNVVVIKLSQFNPVSGFIRPFFRASPKFQSCVVRAKHDPYFQDSQFLPTKQNQPAGMSISFKVLNEIKHNRIIGDQYSEVVNKSSPQNLFFAFSMLARDIFRVKRLFQNLDDKSSYLGIWLCQNGFWKMICTDSYLPAYHGEFAGCSTSALQAWPSYIQKALAKMLKGYSTLKNISISSFLRMLTGNYIEKLNLKKVSLDKLKDTLAQASERRCPIWADAWEGSQHGVTGVSEVIDYQQVLSMQEMRVIQLDMVKIRPLSHPEFQYKGPMSRESLSDDLKEQLRYASAGREYWLPFSEVTKCFQLLGVCWYQEAYFTTMRIRPAKGSYFLFWIEDLPPCQFETIGHKQGIGLALLRNEFESVAVHGSDGYIECFETIKTGYLLVLPPDGCPQFNLKYAGKEGFQFSHVEERNDDEILNKVLKRCALTDAEQLDCYDECPEIVRFEGERLGIRFFYFLNESKDAVLNTRVKLDEIVNLRIDRPFLDNECFSVQVAAGEDQLVKYLRIKPGETGYVVVERSYQVIKSYSEKEMAQIIRNNTREFNRKQLRPGVCAYKLSYEGKMYWMLENKSKESRRGVARFRVQNLKGSEQVEYNLQEGEYILAVFTIVDQNLSYSLDYNLT